MRAGIRLPHSNCAPLIRLAGPTCFRFSLCGSGSASASLGTGRPGRGWREQPPTPDPSADPPIGCVACCLPRRSFPSPPTPKQNPSASLSPAPSVCPHTPHPFPRARSWSFPPPPPPPTPPRPSIAIPRCRRTRPRVHWLFVPAGTRWPHVARNDRPGRKANGASPGFTVGGRGMPIQTPCRCSLPPSSPGTA